MFITVYFPLLSIKKKQRYYRYKPLSYLRYLLESHYMYAVGSIRVHSVLKKTNINTKNHVQANDNAISAHV